MLKRERKWLARAISIVVLAGAAFVVLTRTAHATPGADDYPFKDDAWCQAWTGMNSVPPTALFYNAGGTNCEVTTVDDKAFYKSECTSFVAWRMTNDNGMTTFRNTMTGPNGQVRTLGNAVSWAARAVEMGFSVNSSPAVGSVAWWSSGHVAWVRSVVGDNVVVEEYNYNWNHRYSQRSIHKSVPTSYIHFHDLPGGGGGGITPPSGGSPLSALSFPSGSQSLFWRGPDGDLWESWYADGAWHGPIQLHMGQLGSSPAVVRAPATNWQWVFWRGMDSHLWGAYYNGSWHGPLLISATAVLDSQPTVAAHGNEIDIFWRGPDKHLYEVWGNGTTWYGPVRLGMGPLGSAPTAAANSKGEQMVFWKGTDNNLWEAWYAGGRWYGPVLLPIYNLGSAPAVTVRPVNNEVDIFWKGTDNNLWQAFWNGSWYGPISLGKGPLGSAPTVTAWGTEVDVYWRGTNSNWWEAWYAHGSWYGPATTNMGPVPTN